MKEGKRNFQIIQLLVLSAVFLTNISNAQPIYKGANGKARFYSEALLEDIEATTTKSTSVLNSETGEVAVVISIKSFVFQKSLMQEHFNENYMESDKYPQATFKGKLIDPIALKTGETLNTKAKGELTIHGVSLLREIPVKLRKESDDRFKATGKFMVKVAEHKIKIPTIVFHNIAEEVEVTFDLVLKSK